MKPLTRSAVRTHQYCCVSSLRVSFSVENYRSIRNNRASRLFESGFHPWERGCASSSLAGNICFLGNRKIRAIDCCSLPDDDMDNSLVTEPNKTGSNSVLEDAAFLFKLVGVSFAGGALIKYGSLFSSIPFTPSPAMALSIVMFPPLAFAIWMLAQGESGVGSNEKE